MSGLRPWVIYEVILVHRGMLAPEHVRTYETTALVDTGTTHTVVPAHVAERLGLAAIDEILVQFADGRPEAVVMSDGVFVEIQGRRALEAALVSGDDVLVGQIVLEAMDWSVDCRDQRLIQNPRHPNGPLIRL